MLLKSSEICGLSRPKKDAQKTRENGTESVLAGIWSHCCLEQ
jgi:hypothetical protein